MTDMNAGLTSDPLFVGATRPPMRWGVTYAALLFNLVFSLEVFLLSKNLLSLLLAAPIHGVCALLCARAPRFFDLVVLWVRTRLPGQCPAVALQQLLGVGTGSAGSEWAASGQDHGLPGGVQRLVTVSLFPK